VDDTRIAVMLENTLGGLGFEMVDLELSRTGALIRVFIDRAGGVGVDDCASVSSHLTRLFAVEAVDYDRLEVSSPGLDRPLKKEADFERFAGHEVQLRLAMPVGNQRNFVGVLQGLKDGVVSVHTAKGEMCFPLEEIEKARLVPKF